MNSEGQFFGMTRLLMLIEQHHERTAPEIADLVLRDLDWFSNSAPLSDDRTLVVIKVK
jgi:serine phosphatase RsbU (regulator of sigma subunit)